ncbi:hypothetical protein I6J77_14105 [Rhodanobacter sp. FDAARGOS 1247]|uniref:hypothetical protein n=1 Tax=Rhodanobacter sp. FDAARGOS 1247 TaxID=2778082 RepID=UPI001950725D|nr:hypothetical protein [Rhodanobacter sp. FDAARGOS 1247]QRP63236.1 hypothetical protein I6J77_14105 [Rhodanobacter sp. FDAARGOS 1247]
MRQLPFEAGPPFDFWAYIDTIPTSDFAGYSCHGGVTYVWEDVAREFQHVMLNTQHKNVFMVIVLDLACNTVKGHRLLNLNELYTLSEG